MIKISKNIKLSLVVPCYNEQDNVKLLYSACKDVFSDKLDNFEVVFVNDGSRDNTWKELKELYEKEKNIKLVNFSRNFGKEAAMYAGLQKAVGDYVTIIDADLQQRPETVLEMVEFLDNNDDFDCVVAYQDERREGKLLSFYKKCFYKLINAVCEIDFRSGASDFRTFRHNMVESILEMKEYFRFSKGIFSWVGYNVHYMPYIAEERNAGKTSWSFRKLFKYAMEGILAFTTFPLKLATYAGGICSFLSLLYMVVVIIQKLAFGIDIPGYPTLIVLILFIGGIQMILLGIIGLYISKMYIEGKRRPIYIAKEYLDSAEKKDD